MLGKAWPRLAQKLKRYIPALCQNSLLSLLCDPSSLADGDEPFASMASSLSPWRKAEFIKLDEGTFY